MPVEDELDLATILPIAPYLEDGDEEVIGMAADAILANIRYNGLHTLGLTLRSSPQEMPSTLRNLIRKVAGEYIALDKYNPHSVKSANVWSFCEILFTDRPLRPYAQVRADAPLIRAIAAFCETERREKGGSRELQDQILEYLGHDLSVQPPDYLSAFTPWRKFLLRSIPKGTYSKKALEKFHDTWPKTSAVADFYTPILDAFRKLGIVDDYGDVRFIRPTP